MLKDARELGIAEGNVCLLRVGQGVDAISEGEQRAVDVRSFYEALADIRGEGGTFGTSEVDQS